MSILMILIEQLRNKKLLKNTTTKK